MSSTGVLGRFAVHSKDFCLADTGQIKGDELLVLREGCGMPARGVLVNIGIRQTRTKRNR